ncbi:MAG: hypothetical protein E7314_02840 [Clostridiales bacterium]|nr:hypothetical protein [Clostridiales bacterium]
MTKNEKWYFHNTKELLKKYRQVIMCVDENLDELGTSINDIGDRFSILAEFMRVEDIDVSNVTLENHLRSMERTRQMIKLIDSAIAKLRRYDINGEEFYWILYLKYICDNNEKCRNDADIIERMCDEGVPISSSTFYRRHNMAIEALSNILWGYTSKHSLKIVDKLKED